MRPWRGIGLATIELAGALLALVLLGAVGWKLTGLALLAVVLLAWAGWRVLQAFPQPPAALQ